MFLKAKDMQALMSLAIEMKMKTMGEVVELSKTLQTMKSIYCNVFLYGKMIK